MEIRSYAAKENRKGGGVNKGPDLSAFPIPRKGGARPLSVEEPADVVSSYEAQGQETPVNPTLPSTSAYVGTAARSNGLGEAGNIKARPQAQPALHPAVPISSGQTVATTVKLDEGRYLRLADAGKPGPGRLKRRTIQEIMVEALDEWFARRGL
jgi:hypothetical protein